MGSNRVSAASAFLVALISVHFAFYIYLGGCGILEAMATQNLYTPLSTTAVNYQNSGLMLKEDKGR